MYGFADQKIRTLPADTIDWFGKSKRRQWCRFHLTTMLAGNWRLEASNREASDQLSARIVEHNKTVLAVGKRNNIANERTALDVCSREPLQPVAPDIAE